ncbi:7742_t:CDS:2 [Diversispora eburnea]|uniref:7742_t:CDS:1 n=1 Tax=Diversispora eburnea TaxID=1213867 RepID=A0A9N8W729_9GLOM|nr:7742_t:CDS:2 [Diversispora eburnea]
MAANVAEIPLHLLPYGELFTNFFRLGSEIITLTTKAEHNLSNCEFFKIRINAAMASVKELNQRNDDIFFTKENIDLFNAFVHCMKKIKKYIIGISQLGRIQSYLQGNIIEKKFKDLTTEFDSYMQSLHFSFVMIYLDRKEELRIVKNEVKKTRKFISQVKGGIPDPSNQNVSTQIHEVLKMNIDFQKQHKAKSYIVNESEIEIADESLQFLDQGFYHTIPNCKERGKISKRLHRDSGEEAAFKEFPIVSSETELDIKHQVIILQRLKTSDHIIKFYGIVKDEHKFFLVTEWMEEGDLIEYYEKYPNISWKTKIDFAIDILNKNHKVKIANFGLSRTFTEVTRNIQKANLDIVRYMAPEKLQNDKKHDYDVKCEIYSFGALLWEIAEEKRPFNAITDFQVIRDLVLEKLFREPLSDGVPDFWRNLGQAPDEPDTEESSCFYNEEDDILDINTPINTPGYMSVQQAIDEHKNGNKKIAWKCFCDHADKGDVTAKFWVGYYLFNYDNSEIDEFESTKEKNLIKAAQLFKESADNGKTEAQYWYGTCLWSGKGVKINYNEALKYLKKAADKGYTNAMYNVGSAYYTGKGVDEDKGLGIHYLRKAAGKNHTKAIEMCRSFKIPIYIQQ